MSPKKKCCICSITSSPKLSTMGISIHKFPGGAIHQKEIVRQWCLALGEKSADALKLRRGDHSGLNCCSLHFEDDCFVKSVSTKKKQRLKPYAVPTKCLEPAQCNNVNKSKGAGTGTTKKMVVKLPVGSNGNKTRVRSSRRLTSEGMQTPLFTNSMEDELELVDLDSFQEPIETSGALGVGELLRLQRKFVELQSASIPHHLKLSVLLAEEEERPFDDELDLTIRPFKPIQLVSWLRLHRAHLAGEIRVRFLFNTDENSCSKIVILHPAAPFDAASIDIHNLQPDFARNVPQLVSELIHPHVSSEAIPLFALLAHDGADWRLMGRLSKEIVVKGGVLGPSIEPKIEQGLVPLPSSPFQDPRVDALEQRTSKLAELVSVMSAERIHLSTNITKSPSKSVTIIGQGALPFNSFVKEELHGSMMKNKGNRGLLGSLKFRKMQVKLINYRVKIGKVNSALDVKVKENAELRLQMAEKDRELSELKQKMDLMATVLKPGLASIMSSCSGVLDNLNIWTVPPLAPPTPAASPQPLSE